MKNSLNKTALVILLSVSLGGWAWMSKASDRPSNNKNGKTPPVAVDNSSLPRDNKITTSYASVVKRIAPSVVNIYSTKTVRNPMRGNPLFNDPFFRRFFGDQFGGEGNQPRSLKEQSLGSGVVVTEDGYILTNNHVVDGADDVKVALANGGQKKYPAKVVGRDPKTDLAVLKIDAKGLSYATLGNSDKLEVGDVVLAIGNPFGIGQTVTMGIISATGRGGMGIEDYEDFIQTDAAINPGNSGGALVDAEGRVIGINTAILSRSGGNMGVGFAVPINLARNVMDQLMTTGKVVRGFLGVGIQPLSPELAGKLNVPEEGGALVRSVSEKGAAAAAGIRVGDVITSVNGQPVKDARSLQLTIGNMAPGAKVDVKLLRDGKQKDFKVTLKEMPGEPRLASRGNNNNNGPAESEDEALKGVEVADLDANVRSQLKLPADLQGAVILSVDPNSAAAEVGLQMGDVIQDINKKPVTGAEDAVNLSKLTPDKKTLVRFWRNGESQFVVVDESKESK
jgi:serine protease Do